MQAVIYCRVSTKEQVENLSLATQRKACEDYCRREGWDVARVFVEEGESAKTTDRTELKRMLDYCRVNKNTVGVVVVYSVSRFSRNTSDHLAMRASLAVSGIILRSATEPLAESSSGKLFETMVSAFAQYHNDEKSERTRAGMKAALQLGRWTWQPPFGYARGERGRPSMKPHPDYAATVREAFEAFANGIPKADVLGRLKAHGLAGRGAPNTFKALDRMLRNPLYGGRIERPEWGVARAGDFEALVDETTFDLVRRRLTGRLAGKRRYAKDNPSFPLNRFIRCARCESQGLSGYYAKGRYPYYECHRCRVRVPKQYLEQAFVRFLQSLQLRPEVMRRLRAMVLEAWMERESSARAMRARQERALGDLRSKLDRIADLLADGTLDAETYQHSRVRLREQVATAEAELATATHDHLDADVALSFGETLLTDAARLWEHSTPEHKRRLQSAYFPNGLTWKIVRNEWDQPGEWEMEFRTRLTPSMFGDLSALAGIEGHVASPTGFEPVPPP